MAGTKVQIKRSSVAGRVPTAADIDVGQLAINFTDKRFFTKDGSNTVIDVFGQSLNTTANVTFRDGAFANLTATTITGNLDWSYVTSKPDLKIDITGDVTGNQTFTDLASGSLNVTLANTTVAAGTYGNSSVIPVITVDSKGRITAATTNAVAGITGYSYTSANNTFAITAGDGSVYKATIDTVNTLSVSNTLLVTGVGTFSNDVNITGNLTVQGAVSFINTTTLNIGDNFIVLNANTTGAPALNAGIEINRGTSANVTIEWDEATDHWSLTNDGTTFQAIATNNDVSSAVSSLTTLINDKSANAYSNAVSTAAADASTKAATAYTNAASHADTVAATAYSNAVTFATTAAATAYSNAVSTAAADASTKAATAYSNAVSYTDTQTTAAYSNATSYADLAANNAYASAVYVANQLATTGYGNAVAQAATLANAAYSNAVSVAASDATAKANTAYSNAVAQAATLADTAYSNAVSRAFTIAGTAYSNAVFVATADATTKADAAYSNAISVAAADASTKADTAYSNAVATASSDASTKAATAYSNAISTASADATSKAATAYSNAVSVAAADASTKAATAYSNAVSVAAADASTKAAQAYSNATSAAATDASIKAGTAFANAVSTAAADASTKAATAYSNAVSYADVAATTAYNNATTFATNKAANAYANAIAYAASNTYVNATFAPLSGATLINASLAGILALDARVVANGTSGSAGQVLTTNGSNTYWSNVATSGFTNGQSISVANLVITGALTANGGNGTAGQVLTTNGTTTYWSTVTSGSGTTYVISTAANASSANVKITGADGTNSSITFVGNGGIAVTSNGSVITVDGSSVTSGGNSFSNIVVAGQANIVADQILDTLTLIAGNNIVLTTNANNDSITISSTASGGGGGSTGNSAGNAFIAGRDNFVGDGSTTIFTLSQTATANSILVLAEGLVQFHNEDYDVAGTTLTFTSAPANNERIEVVYLSGATTYHFMQYGAIDTFTGDNTTTGFALSRNANTSIATVYIDGLLQTPSVDFSISGSTLTFTSAPLSGETVLVYHNESTATAIPGAAIASTDTFAGDGVTTAFTLSGTANAATSMVTINGLTQGYTSEYTISGTTLSFNEAPASGAVIQAMRFTGSVGIAFNAVTVGSSVIAANSATSTLGFANGAGVTLTTSNNVINVGLSSIAKQSLTGDGSTTAYTLTYSTSSDDIFVYVNGIYFHPDEDYTVANTTLTFTTAPAASADIRIRFMRAPSGLISLLGDLSLGGGSYDLNTMDGASVDLGA